MRILIVGINFYPELTGIGKYTGEMAMYLAAQGNDLHMVTAPPIILTGRYKVAIAAGSTAAIAIKVLIFGAASYGCHANQPGLHD